MLFWNKICGLIAIFFLSVLFASAQSPYIKFPGKELRLKPGLKSSFALLKTSKPEGLKPFGPLTIIPRDYYTQHLGIICKKELAIEKITKIPFRFRLGSLQQCNYLEGKR